MLAEFASVVDAVRCAGEIQRGMANRDLDLAEDRRLRFRIGVNLGDVIADGDDIYGDGVNIAARLEGLAEPGGIVSGTVATISATGSLTPSRTWASRASRMLRGRCAYAFRPEGVAGSPTASVSSTVSGSTPVAAPRLSIVVLP